MASGGYDGTLVEADPYHEDSFGDEDGDGAMFVAFGFEFTSLALSVGGSSNDPSLPDPFCPLDMVHVLGLPGAPHVRLLWPQGGGGGQL